VLSLLAERTAARRAREWATLAAAEAGATTAAQRVVRLLTSEMVHNAVVHGPADGTITVDARFRAGTVGVLVTDESPEPPVLSADGSDPPDCWGMRLVDALAARWGVEPAGPTTGPGKTVWFEVSLDLSEPPRA
jgi:anti-sigma regulatory factor (Ser/Thr protein kinase)